MAGSRVVYDGAKTFPPVVEVICLEEGARQSERDQCDINKIVAQFHRTGQLPMINAEVLYRDVSEMGDYRSALEQVKIADQFFMALPPKIRSRFENDPAQFLQFCTDEANRPELVEMGLITPPDPPVVPLAVAQAAAGAP